MNILFLCTGNSARSILAEAIVNARAGGRVRAFSAGSHPRGDVHPLALEVLRTVGLPVAGLRSKSWDEFAQDTAPQMDVVVTVCSQAAQETCPIWPGVPVKAHWALDDPATAHGSQTEQLAAFATIFSQLERRIDLLLSLPLDFLSPDELEQQLNQVGSSS